MSASSAASSDAVPRDPDTGELRDHVLAVREAVEANQRKRTAPRCELLLPPKFTVVDDGSDAVHRQP